MPELIDALPFSDGSILGRSNYVLVCVCFFD